MSNTYKYKGKALWNNGIEDKDKPEIKKYLNYCKRRNIEKSYFKEKELKLKNDTGKIVMEQELSELINKNP